MITHDGSLVHPDGEPSTAPDPARLKDLLQQASTARSIKGDLEGGLDFCDIICIRTKHVLSAYPMLSEYHNQISLGECSLLWEVLRDRSGALDGVIPTFKLQQWLGEERLPDGWSCSRPKKTIGLLQARKTTNEAAKLSKQIADEAGMLYTKEYHWNWWIVDRLYIIHILFIYHSCIIYYIAHIFLQQNHFYISGVVLHDEEFSPHMISITSDQPAFGW